MLVAIVPQQGSLRVKILNDGEESHGDGLS
jgi:hypothetical protein